MPANPPKSVIVLRFAVLAALAIGPVGAGLNPALADSSARPALTVDEGGPSYDRGTEDGDDSETPPPSNQSPSEDDTQQEARPSDPDFGGCIFEKRELGLLV